MKAFKLLAAFAMLIPFAAVGCSGDDDDDVVLIGGDCKTKCDDTDTKCKVDCDDDACIAKCDTTRDDCKTSCD